MSERSSRSLAKEAYWRGHVDAQASSGDSIRGYCRRHGLSEPSFHSWRRELDKRDAQRHSLSGGGARSTGFGDAGLIAVKIVGDATTRSTASATLEIEFPGGPVIRLREDVSVEVLRRVMLGCQQVHQTEPPSAAIPVRPC